MVNILAENCSIEGLPPGNPSLAGDKAPASTTDGDGEASLLVPRNDLFLLGPPLGVGEVIGHVGVEALVEGLVAGGHGRPQPLRVEVGLAGREHTLVARAGLGPLLEDGLGLLDAGIVLGKELELEALDLRVGEGRVQILRAVSRV